MRVQLEAVDQRASVQDVLDHIRYAKTLREVARSPIRDESETTGSTKTDDKTVRMVQTALAELGYSPGPIDGNLGVRVTRTESVASGSERLTYRSSTASNVGSITLDQHHDGYWM